MMKIIFKMFRTVWCDAPTAWQLSFQDCASPTHEGIVVLHDTICFYLVLVSFLVFWVLGSVVINYNSNVNNIAMKYSSHGTLIELIWTITPALILILIAFPSFKLLYLIDEVISPTLTVKAIGNQWFWSYELSDFINEDGDSIEFDSYTIPTSDLEEGQFRLLDVDNRLLVPVNTHVRYIVGSNDVIHDWAVPSLGIKIDANPGRLNQTSDIAEREGVFYGQCSELCGVAHNSISIVVEAVSLERYLEWLNSIV